MLRHLKKPTKTFYTLCQLDMQSHSCIMIIYYGLVSLISIFGKNCNEKKYFRFRSANFNIKSPKGLKKGHKYNKDFRLLS